MKIAVIVPSLAQAGPVRVAWELCREFLLKGHECDVFYFDTNDCPLEFGCHTYRIGWFTRVDWRKYDVVHVHCLRPALYAGIRLRNHKCTVATLHQPITAEAFRIGGHNKVASRLLAAVSKAVYNRFSCNVVLSDEQKRLAAGIIRTPVEVINNGRSILVKTPKDKKSADDISKMADRYRIIGTASVINKGKGLHQIVKALPYLPDCAFVCIGDGPELSNLKALALQLGVSERCLWLGYKSDSVNYYPYFDVFVMCTYSEGYPLALIEAAANGCAAVLSDIAILKRIMPESCACFYETDNIRSLAAKVNEALARRDELSANIYRHYKAFLTAETMAQSYIGLFGQFVNSSK